MERQDRGIAAADLERLRTVRFPHPPRRPLYLASLWLAALLCALMPLLYLGLVAGIGWLGWLHYGTWAPQLAVESLPLRIALWTIPGFVGGVVLLFLLKPLLAPRAKAPDSVELAEASAPELFRVVRMLCDAIGTRQPVAIHATHDANAWVQFDRGLLGLVAGRKRLTIGLPLAAGMTTRQFTGVLAHEFGHFAQGGGMRSAYIINHVNAWLWSRGYEDDAWDDRLEAWEESGGVAVALAQASLWAVRMLMRGMFQVSFRLSQRLSQEMEFDADRYEATVAGSACFADTSLRLRAVDRALAQVDRRNREAWQEGKLVVDLPAAVAATLARWQPKDWDQVALDLQGDHDTRYWDSHPADQARIAHAEALRAPGVVLDDAPATRLFAEFPAVCRQVTAHFYAGLGLDYGERSLIQVPQLLGLNRIDDAHAAAWQRYTNGMLGMLPLLSPADAGRAPFAALGWQATVDELRRLAPDACGLWERLQRARQARAAAAPWLMLVDLDVDFTMPDGSDPDVVQLREDHAAGASGNPADERAIRRILGLFARRLRHAADVLAQAGDDALSRRLELLQALHDVAPRLLPLMETRHVLARVDAMARTGGSLRHEVYAQAERYREDVGAMLRALDGIALDDPTAGTQPLGKLLRNRCGHLSSAGNDPLRFLAVTAPLAEAFLDVYRNVLAAAAAAGDRAEAAHGIQPLRLVVLPRQPEPAPA